MFWVIDIVWTTKIYLVNLNTENISKKNLKTVLSAVKLWPKSVFNTKLIWIERDICDRSKELITHKVIGGWRKWFM